jgi:hypothetical protein
VRTLFHHEYRISLLARLGRVCPEQPPLWGQMSAPQMLAHLGDQMRLTLGDASCSPMPSPLRYAGIKHAVLYVLPWPKGRVQGPPEAFTTRPTSWSGDLAALEALVARFIARGPSGTWPEHPLFGPLSGPAWGVFCYRHFDHHLRQFGA